LPVDAVQGHPTRRYGFLRWVRIRSTFLPSSPS
jgi:hypothetical protein